MLVGISGLANSGKDTAADCFVRDHQFVKVSFADPLKRIAKDIYAFTDEQLWGPSAMRNAPDKRYLRAKHDRHDWQEDAAHPRGWRCTRCELGGEEAGPVCLVYLTPRYALQKLGTEWGRDCYENTWVDYALRLSERILLDGYNYTAQEGLQKNPHWRKDGPAPGVVIPDVRFKNEMAALRAAGAKLFRITRSNGGLSGSAALHSSEKEQLSIPDSEFDAVIANEGSIDDLARSLTAVLSRLV